jgi:hypothetical protein
MPVSQWRVLVIKRTDLHSDPSLLCTQLAKPYSTEGLPQLEHDPAACKGWRTHMAYKRSKNQDGSMSSHCPDCNRVVSTQACEADLALAEANHICDEFVHRLILERFCTIGLPIN